MSGPQITVSNGMGVDSAALLTRWLLEPDSRAVWDLAPAVLDKKGNVVEPAAQGCARPFELEDLTVVTAMTGNESERTQWAMETYLLPLMRAHGVRYVQVARVSESESDGIEVLSDSRATERMVMRGRITLEDEMLTAGTIPQVSNRICSYRFKGWVLDTWAEQEYAGAPRFHVVGYAAEETGRRDRDQVYAVASAGKTPLYPLITDWGWDRERCLAYLRDIYGFEWPRSCCGFCPFQAGPDIARLGQRWTAEPDQARTAVAMEANALALNPRMRLFGDRSAADVARSFGLGDVVEAAADELAAKPAALYEVRRVYRRDGDRRGRNGRGWVLGPDPEAKATKGSAVWRSLRTVAAGDRAAMVAQLLNEHAERGGELEMAGGVARLWLDRAGAPYPALEHYLVVGVAGVPDKERDAFEELWTYVDALGLPRQGDLLIGGAA